jgi:hypothetical protein
LIDGLPEPDREGLETEASSFLQALVEGRELQHRIDVGVLVKDQ